MTRDRDTAPVRAGGRSALSAGWLGGEWPRRVRGDRPSAYDLDMRGTTAILDCKSNSMIKHN
ncbi:hypothetical protein FA95DRAFT_885503 [Auriscalpium vulgare]|uniref:Uncharacterized protein n=1 Tax=Auriscalpium vulgare TaxID=40419 RepID=A0ACB8R8B3_9AGAM|nr:hypothetical protein FA95DRAFT_885503 [Auriscalpium vulgare]